MTGTEVKTIRQSLSLSVQKFAWGLNVSFKTVLNWEQAGPKSGGAEALLSHLVTCNAFRKQVKTIGMARPPAHNRRNGLSVPSANRGHHEDPSSDQRDDPPPF